MKFTILILLFTIMAACTIKQPSETTGGWVKYDQNPVLGGRYGTIFDISVLQKNDTLLQMFCSWRPERSIALSESSDGLTWSAPVTCLPFDDSSGWERDVNRPVVLLKDGIYKMWYTGETDSASSIGYATSKDGINWTKYANNPVFRPDPAMPWEAAKVTACQVIKRADDFLMFYIGFKNVDFAQIGMARSKDGINNWERYPGNPIIQPGMGWDSSAVYKPYAIQSKTGWLLYYNGRQNKSEQIGIAIHKTQDLGF